MTETSITLLGKLRAQPADDGAWQDFIRRYRPRIHAQCLALMLQPADAEDVTQAVLLKLLAKMPEFHYDPSRSFRAWLKTVTRHAVADLLAERKGERGSGDSAVVRLLDNVQARECLAQQVEAAYDQELLDEALRRVQAQVADQHWQVFRRTALEGLSGAAAGQQLGLSAATVYMIKSRVQKLVREEVERLEGTSG